MWHDDHAGHQYDPRVQLTVGHLCDNQICSHHTHEQAIENHIPLASLCRSNYLNSKKSASGSQHQNG